MLINVRKPKNPRSARAVAKKAPQLIENPKKTLFLRSTTSSSLVNSVVKDLYSLKRPLGLRFTKKNPIHPFEDASSLEFFSQKNDTSLLCFSSHSKKRPHCITFVRCFDAKVLDMLECTVLPDTARLIQQFGGPTARVGIKPMLSFSGPQFEDPTSETGRANKFALAKSLFIDFFRGETAKDIDVEGLELMISFAASEDGLESGKKREVVHMRVWRVITKRSNQRLPRVELEEMGPSLDFVLGRVKEPDNAMLKESLKRAKSIEVRWSYRSSSNHLLSTLITGSTRPNPRKTWKRMSSAIRLVESILEGRISIAYRPAK